LSKMLRSSVLETAVRELQSKAQGLFLYASLLALQLETATTSGNKKKIDFKELKSLPSGLSEVYQVNFERMVQSRQSAWDDSYSQLIALIVAAREPLPTALAREVCVNALPSPSLCFSFYPSLYPSLPPSPFSFLFVSCCRSCFFVLFLFVCFWLIACLLLFFFFFFIFFFFF